MARQEGGVMCSPPSPGLGCVVNMDGLKDACTRDQTRIQACAYTASLYVFYVIIMCPLTCVCVCVCVCVTLSLIVYPCR